MHLVLRIHHQFIYFSIYRSSVPPTEHYTAVTTFLFIRTHWWKGYLEQIEKTFNSYKNNLSDMDIGHVFNYWTYFMETD